MQAVRPAAREEAAAVEDTQAQAQAQARWEEEVKPAAVAKEEEEEEAVEKEVVAVVGDEEEADEEAEASGASAKKNRIQVSTNKKPLYFYVNLAKRYMQNYDEVELSALGMAIGTVVTVAEILKNNGLATEKKILTSTIGTKDESKGRLVRKAKIEILLCKSENFNSIMSSKKSDRPKSSEEEIKDGTNACLVSPHHPAHPCFSPHQSQATLLSGDCPSAARPSADCAPIAHQSARRSPSGSRCLLPFAARLSVARSPAGSVVWPRTCYGTLMIFQAFHGYRSEEKRGLLGERKGHSDQVASITHFCL
ncbi:hypothetical protein GUJ93_ZPchr0012g20644 [Zizania palustris]|uniref:DNA/RNA-binding protein Alba-like domain-containing protein n=1 Tax=Zizania palustris TaxID=103762 RepID=A0A8J5WRE5_ZIZPA|nr:hypothetical protein GUJ93_ZPchr0012g20644 [Zizania palustris]